MERKVVITGIGLITPGGTALGDVWAHLLAGQSAARPLDRFDASAYPVRNVGVVTDETIFAPFPSRLLKRMDRFCCLSMAAAHLALQDSNLDLQTVDRHSIGVYMGNMYGGWGVTDPSLRNLLQEGYRTVSPYVASAWFPTAPQGQITIYWQLKGYSKTIVADTASGALALSYAARAIQEGRADVMLAGGAEAPITPYTYTFCTLSGRLDPAGYRPFGRQSAGFQVGEGAAVLVLEEIAAAHSRRAHIYGQLAGWATGYQPHSDDLRAGQRLAQVIMQALAKADVAPEEVDYVGLDAQGLPADDQAEVQALVWALDSVHQQVAATTCKPALTHLLGAGAAVEIAVALLAMQRGEIPPIAACGPRDLTCPLNLVVDAPRTRAVRTALINARGADGVQAALVFKAL